MNLHQHSDVDLCEFDEIKTGERVYVRSGGHDTTEIQFLRLSDIQLFEKLAQILPKESLLDFVLEKIEDHEEILSLLPSKNNHEGKKGLIV